MITDSIKSPHRFIDRTMPAEDRGALRNVVENVDFDSADALSDAYRRIIQMLEVKDFCACAFNDVDQANTVDALATLILCRHADETQQRTDLIPGSRDEALTTLAAHLSPTGNDALRQTLDANAAPHAFSDYLGAADRHSVAGYADLEQLKTNRDPDIYTQAAGAFAMAAELYEKAGRDAQVANVAFRAGLVCHSARKLAPAGDAFRLAVTAAQRADLPEKAAMAFLWIGATEQSIAFVHGKADERALEAEAFKRAADAFMQGGWSVLGERFYRKAAHTFDQAKLPEQAQRARENAVVAHLNKLAAAIDFSDAQAVDAALLSLQTLALTLFSAEFFEGADSDGLGRALAALMLAREAWQRHQPTQWIVPSLDDACRTLAERLTPTGQAALLHSVEGSQGESAFSQYVTEADLYCLAGHLHLQRADALLVDADVHRAPEDTYAQAADDYLKAADRYLWADQFGPAAEASQRAAGAYQRSYQPLKAADAWLQAADLYTRTQQLSKAANARRQATAACRYAANGYLLAGAPAQAADAWRRTADLYMLTQHPKQAADAWLKAADLYTRTQQPQKAADAGQQAEACLSASPEHEATGTV